VREDIREEEEVGVVMKRKEAPGEESAAREKSERRVQYRGGTAERMA
jgi:hypothetical protein